jgi:hypothetical protein
VLKELKLKRDLVESLGRIGDLQDTAATVGRADTERIVLLGGKSPELATKGVSLARDLPGLLLRNVSGPGVQATSGENGQGGNGNGEILDLELVGPLPRLWTKKLSGRLFSVKHDFSFEKIGSHLEKWQTAAPRMRGEVP